MKPGLRGIVFALLFAVASAAIAEIRFRHFEEDDEPQWQEAEAALPAFPQADDLLEFYVSPGTTNKFYIDGKTINPGSDGVVRFAMVVKTSGGATNISFEGIRCSTLESRLYATGANGKWVKARKSAWQAIENNPVNRQHAALSRDYFCPSRVQIWTAEEGRDALRRGKHPNAK